MEIIGIICEYNPFHNGHIYHLKKIKTMYPESLIILILNGYFLERGEISVLTKEDKVKIALENNIDLVIELPAAFGTQSADIFAETGLKMLNLLKVNKIIFGSESNDLDLLTKAANVELEKDFDLKVKSYLNEGLNYPTALNKAINIEITKPNDLLGISYLKAIIKNKYSIVPQTIKRTSDYHDKLSNESIISASNIRQKIKDGKEILEFTPCYSLIKPIDEDLLFNLIKYKILTDKNLNKYLDVDEGIENKLFKEINNVTNIDDLILKVKSKRYTYNRLKRMLIHILIGLTKEDAHKLQLEYIKVLGFNQKGKNYLKLLDINIPVTRKISEHYRVQEYELTASKIYDLLTKEKTIQFELSNKPIIKDNLNEKMN